MKPHILAFLAALVFPFGAEAATMEIGGGFGPLAGVMPQTIGGVVLAAGGYYIGVGTFPSIPTLQNFLSSFNEFGSATSPTAGPAQGKIAASITSSPANPAHFNAQELFIVVGNAATRAASTEFIVLRGTDPTFFFPADTAAAGGTSLIIASNANIEPVFGFGKEIDNPTGGDLVRFPTLDPTVPEPGTALLAAAAAGLMSRARRRR